MKTTKYVPSSVPQGFTPGPWHTERGNIEGIPNKMFSVMAGKSDLVCLWRDDIDTNEANAKLISAAPELVAAVQECLEYLIGQRQEYYDRCGKCGDDQPELIGLCRVALAKAGGKLGNFGPVEATA